MRSASLLIALLFACLLALSTFANAQQATAQVNGTVKDPSGAVVSGAKVTLKNSDTGAGHTTTTNEDGIYVFTLVPIGTMG